jgi:hypothetical protein
MVPAFPWARCFDRAGPATPCGCSLPQDGQVTVVTPGITGIGRWHSEQGIVWLIPDGLFEQRPNGHVRFVPLLAPSDNDVHRICGQVAWRVDRLLQRHADEAERTDQDEAPAANLTLALAPCTSRRTSNEGWEHPQRSRRLCADIDGFSLYAGTSVAAEDRAGLERLCRYGLRSSFALNRLSLLDDGRVCYRLKRPWPGPGGVTQLVLDPLDFLGRLAHLLPPPRSNLIRYHGAFAPNAAIRTRLLPRLERPKTPCSCPGFEATPQTESQGGSPPAGPPPQAQISTAGFALPGPEVCAPPGTLDDLNVPPMLIGPSLAPQDLLPPPPALPGLGDVAQTRLPDRDSGVSALSRPPHAAGCDF